MTPPLPSSTVYAGFRQKVQYTKIKNIYQNIVRQCNLDEFDKNHLFGESTTLLISLVDCKVDQQSRRRAAHS